MLISTALLLDSIIRNSVCTPAKLPCRRVEVGYEKKKQASSSIVFLSFVAPETHPSSFRIKEKIIESPRTAKSDLEA
jgi:hypothetical protein